MRTMGCALGFIDGAAGGPAIVPTALRAFGRPAVTNARYRLLEAQDPITSPLPDP
jgi:hypothetical protein